MRLILIDNLPDVRFNLGMAYRNLGQSQEAKENLLLFIEKAKKNSEKEIVLARKWLQELGP